MIRDNPPVRTAAVSIVDYRALSEFRYRVRQFLNYTEATARGAGIHPQQHRLLLTIKGIPAGVQPSIGNLAERLQIEHHSAVELVDRAADSGLVLRKPDAADRRVVNIVVTSHGEALLERLSVQNREELRSAAPDLVKALRALTRKNRESAA